MQETKIVVTTTYDPSAEAALEANRVAEELRATFVPRGRSSLNKLRARRPGAAIVVVGAETLEWHPENGGPPFFFHPGMSLVRAKRLAEGGRDAMLEACRFEPGDAVVDCTAGLGADAIVFSFAGGERSRVVAVESERPLHFVVTRGLKTYESGWAPFDEALRRIATVRADHTAYLRSLPDRSVDIVYFDPMFESPVHASQGLSPLRSLANARPLSEEAVREARRVARKSVVLKERGGADVWERLGFDAQAKSRTQVAYGVITL
ncbi:class I SAM-dependent methyltransferase [Paenibacillus sp.]|uniref:class I SAM-dependent methyltransferase n=1 Tax=Paenibacillus sp. TaxID=58172 RepID=UPI002D33964F|nr:class I SAM-dependent methyltransferase [Paenibacillus sp.]HZG88563.1 class I SAM-dependent methyltransferase [Paenibacillus sp.]